MKVRSSFPPVMLRTSTSICYFSFFIPPDDLMTAASCFLFLFFFRFCYIEKSSSLRKTKSQIFTNSSVRSENIILVTVHGDIYSSCN
jgi:hypothetical protein